MGLLHKHKCRNGHILEHRSRHFGSDEAHRQAHTCPINRCGDFVTEAYFETEAEREALTKMAFESGANMAKETAKFVQEKFKDAHPIELLAFAHVFSSMLDDIQEEIAA